MTQKMANEVQRVRERIAEAKAELDSLDSMKVPQAQAATAVERLIETHAAQGRLQVGYIADGQPLPHTMSSRSAFDLLCWISPDLVRTRFISELADIYEGAKSLEPAKASSERARLTNVLFDLEVEEERMIMRSENLGFKIPRRGDADPRAVLEA